MAERWFLKIDGIDGESTHVDHKNEIDVQSWSWGLTHPGSPGGTGGGGGAGKAVFDDFHFVNRISKASPALFLACASGSHMKSARLTGRRDAGKAKSVAFLKVDFQNVMVSSLTQGDSEAGEPVETLALNFTKITYVVIPFAATGAPQPPVSAGWDLELNKKL